MKVRIIGCHGGVAPNYQTTCFQVESRFLIDCGSACSSLTPKEQSEVTDIFITHPHLDHIKDICFILENTFSPDRPPLVLRSTEAILNDVHTHLLNNIIWPDFSKIPVGASDKRLLHFEPFEKTVTLDEFEVTHFRVNHPGNACGYLVDNGKEQVVFSGDTGPNAKVWEIANNCKNLKAIITEISFPSRMEALATASGHYTIDQLLEDMENLKSIDLPIYISHFKPLFMIELMKEFKEKAPKNMILMHEDDELVL